MIQIDVKDNDIEVKVNLNANLKSLALLLIRLDNLVISNKVLDKFQEKSRTKYLELVKELQKQHKDMIVLPFTLPMTQRSQS